VLVNQGKGVGFRLDENGVLMFHENGSSLSINP